MAGTVHCTCHQRYRSLRGPPPNRWTLRPRLVRSAANLVQERTNLGVVDGRKGDIPGAGIDQYIGPRQGNDPISHGAKQLYRARADHRCRDDDPTGCVVANRSKRRSYGETSLDPVVDEHDDTSPEARPKPAAPDRSSSSIGGEQALLDETLDLCASTLGARSVVERDSAALAHRTER